MAPRRLASKNQYSNNTVRGALAQREEDVENGEKPKTAPKKRCYGRI